MCECNAQKPLACEGIWRKMLKLDNVWYLALPLYLIAMVISLIAYPIAVSKVIIMSIILFWVIAFLDYSSEVESIVYVAGVAILLWYILF